MKWTDDQVKLLRKLWSGGSSASQIAAALGGISRNSVIGKIDRLGLYRGSGVPKGEKHYAWKGDASRDKQREKRRIECLTESSVPRLVAKRAKRAISPITPPERVITLEHRCSLLELTVERCHWPIGDPQQPDFFFCGAPSLDVKIFGMRCSYCAGHAQIAYQPATKPNTYGVAA